MPYPSLVAFFLISLLQLSFVLTCQAISYSWNGTSSTTTSDWNTPANWTPAGVPGASDQVTIGACTTQWPILTGNVNISALIFPQNNNSRLDLGNHTLTVGNLNLWGGRIDNYGSTSEGTIKVSYVSDIRYISFHGSLITIDVSSSNTGRIQGGNNYYSDIHYKWNNPVFNSFIIGYNFNERYWGEATFTATGAGWLHVSFFPTSTFDKKVTLNTSGTAGIQVGTQGNVTFKDEVLCNNYSNSAIVFPGGGGISEFRKAVTLNQGSSAFSISFGGTVNKSIFTETATLQTGTLTGGRILLNKVEYRNATTLTSIIGSNGIEIGSGSSFAGHVSLKSAHVVLRGVTFNGDATIEKTSAGATANNLGGNTFHGTTILKNSGGGNWFFGQNTADTFNGDLTVLHSGGNGTYLAHWNAGHIFRGNLTLTLSAGATGTIQLGGAGGASEQTTETGEKTLTVNAFSGNIRLAGFTQRGTSAPFFNLNTPTSTASLTLSGGSLFEAPVSLSVPQLFLNGATFNQASSFTKTGSGSNNSTGGNVFKRKVSMHNTATSGEFTTGNQTDDLIND